LQMLSYRCIVHKNHLGQKDRCQTAVRLQLDGSAFAPLLFQSND
jgi:hypothetical protein